ncbi:MAG: LuxR C-terminal-related transcriptional regulator [Pseudomonadota bacterium]
MTTHQDNNEKIALVVDDDIALGKAVGRIGQQEGFGMRSFTSCDEAQAWLDGSADPQQVFCMLVSISQLAATEHAQYTLRSHIPRIYIGSSLTGAQAGVAGLGSLLKSAPFRVMDRPFSMATLRRNLRDAMVEHQRLEGLHTDNRQVMQRFAELTPRQMEIGALVAQGLSNPEIAQRLGISVKTVKTHRGLTMQKTGAASIADLVRLFDVYLRLSARS